MDNEAGSIPNHNAGQPANTTDLPVDTNSYHRVDIPFIYDKENGNTRTTTFPVYISVFNPSIPESIETATSPPRPPPAIPVIPAPATTNTGTIISTPSSRPLNPESPAFHPRIPNHNTNTNRNHTATRWTHLSDNAASLRHQDHMHRISRRQYMQAPLQPQPQSHHQHQYQHQHQFGAASGGTALAPAPAPAPGSGSRSRRGEFGSGWASPGLGGGEGGQMGRMGGKSSRRNQWEGKWRREGEQ